jgi:sensor histidine kinase YesM
MKDNQYQASELKRQEQVKNILIASLLLLLIASVFIWRNINLRKKNEQLKLLRKQAELQQQAQDLEMKALKAQMNPHFIFNSLSSINWFILKNKTQQASDYLTSFSRLIRMVLNNSEKPLISLDEELKMLRLYLDMEQLRLEHSFDYKIEMMNNIDPAEIYMPPMILQPFCENAIWHGLAHKSEKGMLTVNFELDGNILNCTIADNGVGRYLAAQLNNNSSHKEKSMGIQITKSRLSLFNGAQHESEYYNIEDVMNDEGSVGGTKVTLKIKSKEVA